MAEETGDRREFISRIGTFFIIISLFAIIIFIASDLSRNDPGRQAGATLTYVVESLQAIQTRDAGATQVAPHNLSTPTLVPVRSANNPGDTVYFPAFCLGSAGLLTGWLLKQISAPPPKPGARFEAIRKMQQKRREDKARKEGEKKGKKEAEKKK